MNTRRNKHRNDVINALTNAQKIIFAPLSFQAIASIIDLGILKEIDTTPQTTKDLITTLNLSDYTVNTLLEVGESIGLVNLSNKKWDITQLGKAFLYDEMTRINFNFVKDICYNGAAKLKDSFINKQPKGLQEIIPNAKTIYPYLPTLQKNNSWYEFDHYYSDNCYDIIYKIIDKHTKIYDIGGNLGAFEKVCLKNNPQTDITMIDLEENINLIKNDSELKNCKFFATDILDDTKELPKISGCIIMSQFLDCFSKEQIKFILTRLIQNSSKETKFYILEPFIDNQKYDGAKYALVHTSLYFTCMANGYSKMYSKSEMEELIKEVGLNIEHTYEEVGIHDYTLLECNKNV